MQSVKGPTEITVQSIHGAGENLKRIWNPLASMTRMVLSIDKRADVTEVQQGKNRQAWKLGASWAQQTKEEIRQIRHLCSRLLSSQFQLKTSYQARPVNTAKGIRHFWPALDMSLL